MEWVFAHIADSIDVVYPHFSVFLLVATRRACVLIPELAYFACHSMKGVTRPMSGEN